MKYAIINKTTNEVVSDGNIKYIFPSKNHKAVEVIIKYLNKRNGDIYKVVERKEGLCD